MTNAFGKRMRRNERLKIRKLKKSPSSCFCFVLLLWFSLCVFVWFGVFSGLVWFGLEFSVGFGVFVYFSPLFKSVLKE